MGGNVWNGPLVAYVINEGEGMEKSLEMGLQTLKRNKLKTIQDREVIEADDVDASPESKRFVGHAKGCNADA